MQAQTTGHLREYRFNRGILIALAGIGLLIASLVGIRALTDGQSVSQTQNLSPVAAPVVEDPPLLDGWVDPYVEQSAAGLPGTTAGVNSATLSRSANSEIGFTAEGVNSTTLNLDRDGSDVFPAKAVSAVPTGRTSQPHIVAAPQGEGLPMSVLEHATLREIAPGGEGLPMSVMDRAAAIGRLGFTDDSGLNYTVAGAEEIRFLEQNIWEYAPTVQIAGTAGDQGVTVPDYRFLEENVWEYSTPYSNSQIGLTDY